MAAAGPLALSVTDLKTVVELMLDQSFKELDKKATLEPFDEAKY